MRTRLLTATANSTDSSTPPNTKALTSQVVPNSRANCTTFFVSSSRNAAPMHSRSRYGVIDRSGPPATRTAMTESPRMTAMATT